MGIMARSARPETTWAKASSKLAQGTALQSGKTSVQAMWEFDPGSPWYATAGLMPTILPLQEAPL
ncbi:hypothetical protein GCM10011374_10100 [Kocuria dechangensis]|uniref:Uncharacterized protein n=1 Tax=Kocuria dechangensis TaxID=1176249 RepID=A0A917GK50_9MICC|nr:hypothetical protein GCM10011374_10100 [Kocuria dechangensis]